MSEDCLVELSLTVKVDFGVLENIGIVDFNHYGRDGSIVVGITGDIPTLGRWNADKGIIGTRREDLNFGLEEWFINFRAPKSFKYRIFLAYLKRVNDAEGIHKIMRVLAWESKLKPREFILPNDGRFVQRGSLTSHCEIHIRISDNSCKFLKPAILNSLCDLKLYIACSMFVLKPGTDDEDDESSVMGSKPGCHSNRGQPVPLSALEKDRCRIHRGENKQCSGTLYKPGDLVQFFVETDDTENTAIEVEFYQQSQTSNDQSSETLENVIFIGSARFGPFEDTYGRKVAQILSPKHNPIGDLRVHYLVIHPMTNMPVPNFEVTYQHHWKKRAAFNIGHRGLGTSFLHPEEKTFKRAASTKENTLESFRTANQHGADFVEMDVQLTKDHRVVVYHDYEAVVVSKKKRGGQLSYLPVAIKDLNYEDLRELKVHHSSVLKEAYDPDKMNEEDLDPIELQAFPLLSSCFEGIDPDLGFVIEVKYPMELRKGGSEMPNFFEYNFYVDTILREILNLAGSRRILLSCFDPNVCVMLQRKQNKYPVFQLGIAPEYLDSRQSDFERLFWSALSHQLLGVCLESDRLIEVPHLIELAHSQNLVVLAWGEAVNSADGRSLLSQLGVDGIIYDRLHENKEKGALSILKRERSAVSSPVPSELNGFDYYAGDLRSASPVRIDNNPDYGSQPVRNETAPTECDIATAVPSDPVFDNLNQTQPHVIEIQSIQNIVSPDHSPQNDSNANEPRTTNTQQKIPLVTMA